MNVRALLAAILIVTGLVMRIAAPREGMMPAEPVSLLVDPNTAPERVLEALPHIGPSLAARIVEQRDIRPFRSVAELRRVRGVGLATLARIQPYLRIETDNDRPAVEPGRVDSVRLARIRPVQSPEMPSR